MSPRLTSLILASWALCSLALCKADAQITPVAATAMGTVTALTFVWPVDPDNRTDLGQDYAQYNLVKSNYYHTGLDIGAPERTIVRAAAGGHVRRLDMTPSLFNGDNHCMGNVVIIDHGGSFTLYAHLQSIVVADGMNVSQGIQIGTVGRTPTVPRPGCTPPTSSHLHFEVKDRGVLGDITDDGPNWGYTPDHPDQNPHGYHDPILSLHHFSVASGRIRITDNGVSLRVGPGGFGTTAYRSFNTVNTGETYDALRLSEGTSTPACPEGWYQLRRTTGDCANAANCFADTSRPGSSLPDGWVCARFVSVPGPLCDIQMSKPSYVSGDTVTAQVLRIVNPTATLLAVELKLWFEVPGLLPITFVNLGADGSVKLPPGFTINAGPLALFTVTPTLPPGAYAFNCRFLEPETGKLTTEDLNPFTIQLIVVDGDPSDWVGIPPLLTDPQGDGPFDASEQYYPGEDFLNISITNDATNVYFLMEFAGLFSGGIAVFLDTDLDATTGCNGSEYLIFVTASEPGGHLALADYRNCSFANDFPGAITSAPGQGVSRFLEASVSIQTLRTLTPNMRGLRISAIAVAPPPSGINDVVGPPAVYMLK